MQFTERDSFRFPTAREVDQMVKRQNSARLTIVRDELRKRYMANFFAAYLTADDARQVALELGYKVGNWLGSVWHEGFRCIGYGKSNTLSRKGGLIRQWRPTAV